MSSTATSSTHLAPSVYLVDDDPGITSALKLFLRSRKLNVDSLTRGAQFVEQYEPKANNCVVIDVRLPDMTGFEALDLLAERGHEPKAIVITGHGPPPTQFQHRRNPLVATLLKPFDPQDLLQLVLDATSDNSEQNN